MRVGKMARGRKEQTGFTLIEVLIVVVILSVLAALVIPRMIASPEKAMVAEANHMLGALVRAEQARGDTGGGFIGAGTLLTANWNSLGMAIPASASKFVYACTSPTCTAARTPTGGSSSTLTLNVGTNAWSCSTSYTPLSNGGCTLV